MSYPNDYNQQSLQVVGVFYLIFGIGCLVFFFGGVCALLCCCRQRFRGIERKGYVVRDELSAPLVSPSVHVAGATVPLQPYPGAPPSAPGWAAPSYPVDPPPKY